MNILYAAVCYPPRIGGGEIHLHRVAKELAGRGHEVQVISQWSRWRRDWLWGTTVFSDPPARYQYEGIDVSRLGFPLSTRVRMFPWVISYYGAYSLLMGTAVQGVARLMRPSFEAEVDSPQIVHALRMGREFLVKTALNVARNRDIPFVLTPLHHPRWKGARYRQYDRLYRAADAVIALTEYEKRILIEEKRVGAGRVFVTGIGPILARDYSGVEFRKQYGIAEPYVLFLGRQVRHKGSAALLKAARMVWQKHRSVGFVFIGPRTRESESMFRDFRDPRIFNIGPVDLETKTAALAECELLCVPSTQESFGGVYSEAWVFGKPVIGGRTPQISCVIDDGKDGLLCSQRPEELAEKICDLISQPELGRAMGERGQKKVREHFTWNRIADKTEAIYQSLV